MEIADIFVVNKSDREGAERVEREIHALQSLAVRSDNWTPPIIKTVASEGAGVEELAAAITGYEGYLLKENLILQKKAQNWQDRLLEMLRDAVLQRVGRASGPGCFGGLCRGNSLSTNGILTKLVDKIISGREALEQQTGERQHERDARCPHF